MTREEENDLLWEAGHRSYYQKAQLLYQFRRISGSGRHYYVNGIHKTYSVNVPIEPPRIVTCDCRGYAIRNNCSHIEAAKLFAGHGNRYD